MVEKVREAFKTEEVIRLDCTHVETSDTKKIGVKLQVRLSVLYLFRYLVLIFFNQKASKSNLIKILSVVHAFLTFP